MSEAESRWRENGLRAVTAVRLDAGRPRGHELGPAPSDSLNIALVNEPGDVTAGSDTTPGRLWEEHSGSTFAPTSEWDPYVPAVQFKAGT